MFFDFIRYAQPAWQFNILPVSESFASCFIKKIDDNEDSIDKNYETKSARFLDAGFSLVNQGAFLESTQEDLDYIKALSRPSLHDEYVFIRKYWGGVWAGFAFFMRIITFKNPIREIKYFVQTRKIKQIKIYQRINEHADFDAFQSALIDSNPLVAVIIPTLNRYEYLKDVLQDLEKQDYKNFETIVVDQSDDFDENFYSSFNLSFKIIHQKEKKLWTARNRAIQSTKAEYLLFFDDDSRVETNWITSHLKCIDFFKVSVSAGVSIATIGQKVSASYNYFRWATQFDSGNAMVKRDVFKQVGLFDEQFNGMRMGDGEFGYRVYKFGVRSVSNPFAARVHLKVSNGGLREMGSWDGFRPKKWFAPKPVPSVIYLYKKYLPKKNIKNALFIGIMLSNISYKQKRSSKMLFLSFILTFLKSPLLLIQFLKAYNIAKHMLVNDKGFILLKQ